LDSYLVKPAEVPDVEHKQHLIPANNNQPVIDHQKNQMSIPQPPADLEDKQFHLVPQPVPVHNEEPQSETDKEEEEVHHQGRVNLFSEDKDDMMGVHHS